MFLRLYAIESQCARGPITLCGVKHSVCDFIPQHTLPSCPATLCHLPFLTRSLRNAVVSLGLSFGDIAGQRSQNWPHDQQWHLDDVLMPGGKGTQDLRKVVAFILFVVGINTPSAGPSARAGSIDSLTSAMRTASDELAGSQGRGGEQASH